MKLTVGQLKRWIKEHKIPDDANVYYQRIEDVYFERHGWNTIKRPWNGGETETEYIEAFGCYKFKDDSNLYINAHY